MNKKKINRKLFIDLTENKLKKYFELVNEIDGSETLQEKAYTTIRISLGIKHKLKKLKKPNESYDDLLLRVLQKLDKQERELNQLQTKVESKDLIKLSLHQFRRLHKSFQYFPDLKIEYSYNDPSTLLDENFLFKLEIDNTIYKGNMLKDDEAMKTIQIINYYKTLKKTIVDSKPENLASLSGPSFENKADLIRTKYKTYFTILFNIVNKNNKKKFSNQNELLMIDFWEELYKYYDLPMNSLEYDVIQKLQQMQQEIKQIQADIYQKVLRDGKK